MTREQLHDAIMNIPANHEHEAEGWKQAYKRGHRDARHAAAELALALLASSPVPQEEPFGVKGVEETYRAAALPREPEKTTSEDVWALACDGESAPPASPDALTRETKAQLQRLATSRCCSDATCQENWPDFKPEDAEQYCSDCWVRLQDVETAFTLGVSTGRAETKAPEPKQPTQQYDPREDDVR